jgi:hypothetical protein
VSDAVYQWFAAAPSRYWLVALPFGALLLAAALQPRRVPAWVFLAVMVSTLAAFRWPAVVAGAESNADESQLIAGANALRFRPVFWRDVDTHAIGPLAVYPLATLGALGLPLDYETARLFGLLVEGVTLAAAWRLLREISGEAWARLGVLPLVAFLALTRHIDYLQYAAETMASALLAVGLATLWIGLRRRAATTQALGAFVLGCTAWSKLQALPPAAALVAGALVTHWLGRRMGPPGRGREASGIGAGFLAALGLPLLGLVAGGLWSDWSNAQVRAGVDYLGASPVGFGQAVWWFLTDPETGFPVYGLALCAVALGLGPGAVRRDPSLRPFLFTLAVAIVVAAAAVAAPGRLYAHYLTLALVLPILPAAAAASACFPSQDEGPRPGVAAVWLALTLLPQAAFVASARTTPYDFLPGINHLIVNGAAQRIRAEAKPGDTLCVWGWEPRLYVMTGLPQATREAHTERLIQSSAVRGFYRGRFLDDFRRAPPTFFVDGIVPDNFAFNDRRLHGFEPWSDLARIIAVDYYFLDSVEGYRIYRRIERKQ